MLGVCSEGLMVYEDEIKTNIFPWPRVLKISYKRSTFLLKMRPSEVFRHAHWLYSSLMHCSCSFGVVTHTNVVNFFHLT